MRPTASSALDDFAAEAEVPSLSDSPREVARKVIAAREVRKRQVKKKAPEPAPDLISGLTADETLPVETLAAEPLLVVAEETSDAVVEPVLDVPIVGDSIATTADDVIAAPLLEAVELTPQVRDLSERVVAVDEFRAREASNSKPERAWPRVPERLAFEKPFDKPLEMQRPETERAVPDRSEWAATSKYGAPSILSTPIPSVPSAIDEPLAVEGLSPSYDEPARDQPRHGDSANRPVGASRYRSRLPGRLYQREPRATDRNRHRSASCGAARGYVGIGYHVSHRSAASDSSSQTVRGYAVSAGRSSGRRRQS